MKNRFWKISGWLTIPGHMYCMRNQKLNEPIKPMESRREVWIGLILAVIATVAFGSIAGHFGNPIFRGTVKELLSPLAGIVMWFNLIFAGLSLLGLKEGNWETPTDKDRA